MDQVFEGTPRAEIYLEERRVVRGEVSNDWGSDGVDGLLPPLSEPPIALLPLMTASEFLLACVNTVENADWIVSVRT